MTKLKTICLTLLRDIRSKYLFFKTRSFIQKCLVQDKTLISNFHLTVEKHSHKTCFIFQDERWTFKMIDEFSNKIANYFVSRGYSKGDEVALMMDNCPEYACVWLGLAKIGVVTALINTDFKRDSLGNLINCIGVKAFIFGSNFSENVKESIPFFKNKDSMEFFCFTEERVIVDEIISFPTTSLNAALEKASSNPIDPVKYKISFHDKLIYIYTSGTTGLPKAAIFRHSRFLYIGATAQFLLRLRDFEVIYNPLPMYHSSGGLLFVSVIFNFGGSMILRKKFSASDYWKDAAKHKATVGQYIGEICRYLLNQPIREEEKQHCIRIMAGNGLRSHIWEEFQKRFRIKSINEIYGSTEGNANLVNIFGKMGAVGFLPKFGEQFYPLSLIRLDRKTGEILRNEKGFCVRCKTGEPGELIGKIISSPINSFEGYVNQKETEKKIIRNCFKKGDMAFLTGDILVKDEANYLYFLDRSGDTFRWRGENVSACEVENIISAALRHVSCAVYGVVVPNVEGKAGMAAIKVDILSLNLSEFYQNISKRLPSYAVPLFLRLTKELEETGTFKLKKVAYQKEGYNPQEVPDPLFFLDADRKTYIPLTKELYTDIGTKKFRL